MCISFLVYGMHSRDTTVLMDLLWFNVVHYSSLFQYFFSDLLWSLLWFKMPNFLGYLFVNFLETYYYDYDVQYSTAAFLLLVNPRILH